MRTIVFYSYLGGVGRSSLLRHIAFSLARRGMKVIAVDLDLEAPGLHYEFGVEEQVKASADIGLVPYLLKAAEAAPLLAAIDIQVAGGALTLVPAGPAPFGFYWKELASLLTHVEDTGWVAPLLDFKARLETEQAPDVLLLDAPSGVSRLGGLATTVLADIVVCLTLQNAASLDGSRAVLAGLFDAPRLAGERAPRLFLIFRGSGLPLSARLDEKIIELSERAGRDAEALFLDIEPSGECRGRTRQLSVDGIWLGNAKDPADLIWAEVVGSKNDADSGRAGNGKLPVNNLPASLGDLFTGRADLLAELKRSLDQPGATVQAQTVSGLGGVGKTRLAIELAHRHAGEYSGIFFVNADSPSELRRNLAALAGRQLLNLNLPETLQEDQVVEEVKLALRERPGWLLILNNVDSAGAQEAVSSVLPLAGGHVLITSRLLRWPQDYKQLEVDKLDPQTARDYLLKATPKRLRGEDNQLAATMLAEKLGYLPLALELTAAYLRENGSSLGEFLADWAAGEKSLLDWLGPGSTKFPRSLAATWARSFERLSADAQALLFFLGHLAPEPIAVAMFEAGSEVLSEAVGGRELNLKEALADLQRYSLISRENAGKEKTIRLHRLVQAVARDRIPGEEKALWVERVLRLILAFVPEDPEDVRGWPIWNPLRPHATRVLELAEEVGAPQPASVLMGHLGLLLHAKARYPEAEPLLRRALAIGEKDFGQNHPNVAGVLNNLATLLQDMNRLGEAEPLIRRALAIDETSFGPEHPDVARDLNNLAKLLQATNRLTEAEPLIRRALAVDETSLGPEHPDVARDLNNLAKLLQATNRHAEAEPLIRRALASGETSFGPDHPNVAAYLSNLARLLQDTNRLVEAEPLLRRALAIFEGSLGAEHPSTALCRRNLEILLAEIAREGQT